MPTYVRTLSPIVSRHVINGVPEPAEVDPGTLCLLVGDDDMPNTFMLVVDDPNSPQDGDECWHVPAGAFQEVTPS